MRGLQVGTATGGGRHNKRRRKVCVQCGCDGVWSLMISSCVRTARDLNIKLHVSVLEIIVLQKCFKYGFPVFCGECGRDVCTLQAVL